MGLVFPEPTLPAFFFFLTQSQPNGHISICYKSVHDNNCQSVTPSRRANEMETVGLG